MIKSGTRILSFTMLFLLINNIAYGATINSKLLKSTFKVIIIKDYKHCELDDIIKLNPRANLSKKYKRIHYIGLVSNFGATIRSPGNDGNTELSLDIGVNNTEEVVYFEANEVGQCVRKIAERAKAKTVVRYKLEYKGSLEEFMRLGVISEDGKYKKVRKKTRLGYPFYTSQSPSFTANSPKTYRMKVIYGSDAPKYDEVKLDNNHVLKIMFYGEYDNPHTLQRVSRF